jgi:hypothetical protein
MGHEPVPGSRIQYEVDTGTSAKTGAVTVGEFLDTWLEETARRRVRACTQDGYKGIINTWLRPRGIGIPKTLSREEAR